MQLRDSSLLRTQAYVNGAWIDAANGATYPITNPATGEKLADVARCSVPETKAAIDAAATAQVSWSKRTGKERAQIMDAISEAMQFGVVLGGPNNYEAKLSAEIVDRFPGIDLVRFCNSGSEANLMALSVARAVTGRKRVVAFRGAYHGGFLMLDDAHDQLNAPYPIILADYNDIESATAAIQEAGDDLAAVILEPMIGAGGSIPATPDFLNDVADEARAAGALLIFDEVITSRLSTGGLQAVTGVTPDITTLGKYLGGGLTFGAFGGAREIMTAVFIKDIYKYSFA